MTIPWNDVRSWLDKNSILYDVVSDAGMQRIRIDLSKKDTFGGFDRNHSLFTDPSATKQNLGLFSKADVMAAAQALRIVWP